MNDLVLPSLVKSPSAPSPSNNAVDFLEQSAETVSPEGMNFSQSITSLPPNSASIVQGAFPVASLSGTRVGGDILTVQQRFDTTRKKLHQLALAVKKERDSKERAKMVEESRSLQLFSTLLYLTLMMHKIDEIKVLLKESDPSTFVSNQVCIGIEREGCCRCRRCLSPPSPSNPSLVITLVAHQPHPAHHPNLNPLLPPPFLR